MRAKVTTAFNGWAEDEPAPRDFAEGDELRDNLAWQAVNTKVNPDDPNSPMFAEWTQEPTTGERDVLGSSTFRPLWTVQPVGTERPAPGDHPELFARLNALRPRLEAEHNARMEAQRRAEASGDPRAREPARALAPPPLVLPGDQPEGSERQGVDRNPARASTREATEGEGSSLDLKGKMGKKS
jgi:hypothetical protein